MKYHHFHRFFTYLVEWRMVHCTFLLDQTEKSSETSVFLLLSIGDPLQGHSQVGSLTGAVHLSKGNAGVLRTAQ